MFALLAIPPWHELDIESVGLELRKPGGGLSMEGLSHPFDTILKAGLVVDSGSRHLTLDQLHNTLGIVLTVAATQVVQIVCKMYMLSQKAGPFLKVYNFVKRLSVHQSVWLFIRSMMLPYLTILCISSEKPDYTKNTS